MDLQSHVSNYCDISQSIDCRNQSFSVIRESFINQSISYLQFVDVCKELNSVDDSIRRRSILLFSKLFKDECIPLNIEVAQVFFDYFVKRLNEFQITEEVMKAIQILLNRHESLVDYGALSFIAFISTNMKVGTLKYTCRKLIYSTLLSLLPSPTLHVDEEAVGKAIVDVVENEKDPRGVVQVCSILSFVLENYPSISNNLLNDLIMLGVAYFPVTYITPPLVMGNKDVVTSDRVKMAVINVLIASKRGIPLVLPFLETSLRDSSPNSKLQACLALLELVKKHSWSKQMNNEACMTDGEEIRWSDLLYTEYVESVQGSDEEELLLNAICLMMDGDRGMWRKRWITKGLEAILRSPISNEAYHITLLLKEGCQQDASLLQMCFSQIQSILQNTQDFDIQKGLLLVLLSLLLPHSSETIQLYSKDCYAWLFTLTQTMLSRVTIIQYTQFPKDSIPFLLGFFMLLCLGNESVQVDDSSLRNYFTSLIHLSLEKASQPDIMNVIRLILHSPYATVLLQQSIPLAGNENSEECQTALAVLKNAVQEHNPVCSPVLQSTRTSISSTKEQVIVGKRLLSIILDNHTKNLDNTLLWVILDYIASDGNELLHSLFTIYSTSPQFLQTILPSQSFIHTNQELLLIFHQFIHHTLSEDHSLLDFIQQNLSSPYIEEFIHYLFSIQHSLLPSLLTHYCQPLSFIQMQSDLTLSTEWIQQNPLSPLLADPVFSLFFASFMRSTCIDLQVKNKVVEWSLYSLLQEQDYSFSVISVFSRAFQKLDFSISISSTDFSLLIDRLIKSEVITAETILLAFKLLNCSNLSIKEDELLKKKIRVALMALANTIARESALLELLAAIQKNASLIVDYLDSLIPLLISLANTELKEDEDPIVVLSSLRVLKTLADLPLNIVFKYTSEVKKGLLPLLDSKQRVIRQYAASIRNLWFMIH